jgi:hypothetical protein
MTVFGDAEEHIAVPEASPMAEANLPDAVEGPRELGDIGRAEQAPDDGIAVTMVVGHVRRFAFRGFAPRHALRGTARHRHSLLTLSAARQCSPRYARGKRAAFIGKQRS